MNDGIGMQQIQPRKIPYGRRCEVAGGPDDRHRDEIKALNGEGFTGG